MTIIIHRDLLIRRISIFLPANTIYMKYLSLLSLALLLILNSCGESSDTENTVKEELKIEGENEWKEISINEGGFRFQMKVPSDEIAGASESIFYNEDLGELEISMGNNFELLVFEDESQMEMIKNEISNHPFYKLEMVIENDSSLLYRLYTEDGSKEQWHIYTEKSTGGGELIISSGTSKNFSEYEAKKMFESAQSIQSEI